MQKDLTKVKKTKLRKYFLPVIILVLALLMLAFVMTAYKPTRYAPPRAANPNQISRYLTNHLLPVIYNGSQLGEPFELDITQDGLNDVVARLPQPIKLNSITLAEPQVILTPMQITLMVTLKAKPIDLILTIELNPYVTRQGLLNLCINRVMVGAVDITPIAKSIGNKAYSNWLSSTGMDPDNIAAQVCRSLIQDEPFDPLFEIGKNPIRISKIDVATKKMIILLTPVTDEPNKISTPKTSAEPRQSPLH